MSPTLLLHNNPPSSSSSSSIISNSCSMISRDYSGSYTVRWVVSLSFTEAIAEFSKTNLKVSATTSNLVIFYMITVATTFSLSFNFFFSPTRIAFVNVILFL